MNIYIDKRRTGFSCPHIQEKENDRTIVHVVEWEIGSKVVKNTKYSERKYFFFQHFFWKGDLQNETIANREKDWHFHNFHNLDLLAKICPGGFSSSTQTNAWEIVEKQGSEIIDTS